MQEEEEEEVSRAEQLVTRRVELEGVFSPGTPVRRREYLAGRKDVLQDVLRAVSQQGVHAIVFGERGVGKTSIARFIHEIWAGVAKDYTHLIPVNVGCDSDDTFGTVWHKVASEIFLYLDKRLIDLETIPESGAVRSALEDLEMGDASPHLIRRALDLVDHRFIIVIDEFDRTHDPDTQRLFADTIKMLSDHLVDATVILVGVADTVEGLIHEHASINRSLIQVLVPRMERGELQEIVITGLTQVAMSIEEDALDRITNVSKGLPHYTHVLAIHSAMAAFEADRDTVRVDDFTRGLSAALTDIGETLGSNYHQATSSPHKDAKFAKVLLACAITEPDELGYFAPSDVRGPYSAIEGSPQGIDSFMRHLRQFCEEKRGDILQHTGEQTRPRYRFKNPLMQPYVLLRALDEGKLSSELGVT